MKRPHNKVLLPLVFSSLIQQAGAEPVIIEWEGIVGPGHGIFRDEGLEGLFCRGTIVLDSAVRDQATSRTIDVFSADSLQPQHTHQVWAYTFEIPFTEHSYSTAINTPNADGVRRHFLEIWDGISDREGNLYDRFTAHGYGRPIEFRINLDWAANVDGIYPGRGGGYLTNTVPLHVPLDLQTAGRNIAQLDVFTASGSKSFVRFRVTRFIFPGEGDDEDSDGTPDFSDNCPDTANTDQADADGDRIGDACDQDSDNDGVPDIDDTFPYDSSETRDTDGDGQGDNADDDDDNDGIPDTFEIANGLDPLQPDAHQDLDSDGLSNLQEFELGTHIGLADSDGDGTNDFAEVIAGRNPLLNEAVIIHIILSGEETED